MLADLVACSILTSAMTAAGLRVEWCRPFFLWLLPGLIVRRHLCVAGRIELLKQTLAPPPAPLNLAFRSLAAIESATKLGRVLRMGTSWVALGRTPD